MLQANVKAIALGLPTIVYKSLEQVLTTLTKPSVLENVPEVRRILTIGSQMGLIKASDDGYKPIHLTPNHQRPSESPFVVIEGLDGCGKTTLTSHVQQIMKMNLLATPPATLREGNLRDVFDAQDESVRRAYYSFGNYVAANEVQQSTLPVIMDRYWHSTAAYAVANAARETSLDVTVSDKPFEFDLTWPTDLLKPNLVIFLNVSEEERIRRHETRSAYTNTVEEQALAADNKFRENLRKCYRSITGVPFEEITVDCSLEESKSTIISLLRKHFHSLL